MGLRKLARDRQFLASAGVPYARWPVERASVLHDIQRRQPAVVRGEFHNPNTASLSGESGNEIGRLQIPQFDQTVLQAQAQQAAIGTEPGGSRRRTVRELNGAFGPQGRSLPELNQMIGGHAGERCTVSRKPY